MVASVLRLFSTTLPGTVTTGNLTRGTADILEGDVIVVVTNDTASGASINIQAGDVGHIATCQLEGSTSGVALSSGTTWNPGTGVTDAASTQALSLCTLWSTKLMAFQNNGATQPSIVVNVTYGGSSGTRRFGVYRLRPNTGKIIPPRATRFIGSGSWADTTNGTADNLNRRVTLSAVPATAIDEAIIMAYGSANTQATAAQVNSSGINVQPPTSGSAPTNDGWNSSGALSANKVFAAAASPRPSTSQYVVTYNSNPGTNTGGLIALYALETPPISVTLPTEQVKITDSSSKIVTKKFATEQVLITQPNFQYQTGNLIIKSDTVNIGDKFYTPKFTINNSVNITDSGGIIFTPGDLITITDTKTLIHTLYQIKTDQVNITDKLSRQSRKITDQVNITDRLTRQRRVMPPENIRITDSIAKKITKTINDIVRGNDSLADKQRKISDFITILDSDLNVDQTSPNFTTKTIPDSIPIIDRTANITKKIQDNILITDRLPIQRRFLTNQVRVTDRLANQGFRETILDPSVILDIMEFVLQQQSVDIKVAVTLVPTFDPEIEIVQQSYGVDLTSW